MPRPRQMNVDDCAQPGWPIGEHDRPIGEEDRLIDLGRDEQIGAAVLFEQTQEKTPASGRAQSQGRHLRQSRRRHARELHPSPGPVRQLSLLGRV
jgi:hypothetical protein